MDNDTLMQPIYDEKKLADLAKMVIGKRTLKTASKESGLSESFLSRLTTGKLPSQPSRRSIEKLMSPASNPQNEVKTSDVMFWAGYQYTEPDKKTVSLSEIISAFPVYLTAGALERSGQIGQVYSTRNKTEMFTIQEPGKKEIVGIPAICTDSEVDQKITECRWSLLSALGSYGPEIKDKFLIVITNQKHIYDTFDRKPLASAGGEFYLALTEDLRTFTEQRPAATRDINGEPIAISCSPPSFDLTQRV